MGGKTPSPSQQWQDHGNSRVPGLKLPVLRGGGLLLVPEAALVLGPGAQVPRLDEEALGGVDVALGVDLLDADLHAVLGEDDVLGVDLVAGGGRDLLHGEVELVGEDADGDEEDEEDDEREEFAARVSKGENNTYCV
jgi:hypothetical protein